jgi:hypothetical protein
MHGLLIGKNVITDLTNLFLTKTNKMADNKDKQDGRDDSEIDSNDSSEVA